MTTEQLAALKGRRWEVFVPASRGQSLGQGRGRMPNASRRQRVMDLASKGLTARQIGEALTPPISPSGVRAMLTRLRRADK
jgi:hypothetical protein